MIAFHRGDINHKIKMVDQMSSERIKILAKRIVQRNYSSGLSRFSESKFSEFRELMDKIGSSGNKNVVKGFKNDTKLNCKNALKELKDTWKFELDGEQKKVLTWLQGYIETMQV